MAEAARTWRLLNFEQRVMGVGALLLAVSTFGPVSFVELAELLLAAGVLALLRARALGKRFHLPFGDGTVVLVAGVWAGLLITTRLFSRPLGQNLLALVCSGILIVAGAAERAKRPADDIPDGAPATGEPHEPEPGEGGADRPRADLQPGSGGGDLPQ